MEENKPLVSVIVPCYNHAQYLHDALSSVYNQTYQNWECIVINDQSLDNTIEVATEWIEKDSRFKLVNAETNGGLAASRNLGIMHSNGLYILPLDADDKLHQAYLTTVMQPLSKRKNLKLVFTDTQCFGLNSDIVRFKHFHPSQLCHQNQLNCTALFRRKDYDCTEGYRTNMIYGYEDWDFWMQLLKDESQLLHIALPLLFVRVKTDAMHEYLISHKEREQEMRRQLRFNNSYFFNKFSDSKMNTFKRYLLGLKCQINKLFLN